LGKQLEGDSEKLIANLETLGERDPQRYKTHTEPALARYRRLLSQRDSWHPPFERAMFATAGGSGALPDETIAERAHRV